jgi:probable HAF family extracellular repeat protein
MNRLMQLLLTTLSGALIAGCGDGQSVSTQTQAPAAKANRLLAAPVAESAPWTPCAVEDQTCTYSGTREVRYGANGVYAYKTLPGPVQCTNAVFGDPLPGIDKACSVAGDMVPSLTWTYCANEGQTCTVPTSRQVRYGANGVFSYRTAAGAFECGNAVFGDPVPGVDKTCSYADDMAPPADAWIECAPEDQQCTFAGKRQVRYGASATYVYKTLAGPVQCTNSVFGDPIPGIDKTCSYLRDSSASTGNWTVVDLGTLGGEDTRVTDINDAGTVIGASQTADGSRHAFVYHDSRMSDLGVLSGDNYSEAVAINNAGVIVGSSLKADVPTSSRVFLFDGKSMGAVPLPFAATATAHDINDSGDILLEYYYSTHGGCTSFPTCNYVIRKNSAPVDLQRQLAKGLEINNAGVVMAHAGNSREPTVLYNINDGSTVRIASLPGGASYPYYMFPTDMNSKSDVVGYTGDGRHFLYQNGTAVDIQKVLDEKITSLDSINDNGDLTGSMTLTSGATVFIYDNGSKLLIDLNSLKEVKQAGWKLEEVSAINNLRQVIGYGVKDGRRRAFLLSPN